MKAKELAKHIIDYCISINNPISNLQLQKILYFVDMFYLIHKNVRLIQMLILVLGIMDQSYKRFMKNIQVGDLYRLKFGKIFKRIYRKILRVYCMDILTNYQKCMLLSWWKKVISHTLLGI